MIIQNAFTVRLRIEPCNRVSMEFLSAFLSFETFLFAVLIAIFAGIVKGVVGFAMPTIMISGFSTFMSPELALAGLIVPTLVTNGFQALRQGWSEALISIVKFRLFIGVGGICLIASAQLVPLVPLSVLFFAIGIPVLGFSLIFLIGWQPKLAQDNKPIAIAVAIFAGSIGGVSGVWGPPTVTYLTAINTPKTDQMRIQGTIYGLGAITLFGAHLQSGVLRIETLPLSLTMVPPALVGLWIGFKLQDKIDQALFKRLTLVVLLIAGANLVRRGILG